MAKRRKRKNYSKHTILALFIIVLILAIGLGIFYFVNPVKFMQVLHNITDLHSGGTATCTEKAVCEGCGLEYGEPKGHEELIWQKTATTHKQYYPCCEIIIVAEENHEWLNGRCLECQYRCSHSGEVDCTICGKLDYKATAKPAENMIIQENELSVHYLELGNANAGDCILAKYGDTEVLIDAGSATNSIETISAYIDTYCTDGILEYVIVTHAHEDHIACFGGSKSSSYRTIFDRYECEIIIDFPRTNSTSQLYQRYLLEREAEVAAGAVRYSALQCYNNQDGAQRVYYLDTNGEVTLNILYNYYYENYTSNENNYSVVCMLKDGDNEFLFTGDLEGEGEELLSSSGQLGQVDVFKAGHHGSNTATTDALLAVINPEIICITTCMGRAEYTDDIDVIFPGKRVCDSIKNYTDKIYVTTEYDPETEEGKSFNGNIIIVSTDSGLQVYCTGTTDTIEASAWYQANRM
ncbi:MAG: MBL fold metallo-hydrolase [Clostridia bacterium]|nr:MBL fold metallo-hydrolase [Clostridia bacterium]